MYNKMVVGNKIKIICHKTILKHHNPKMSMSMNMKIESKEKAIKPIKTIKTVIYLLLQVPPENLP